MANPAFTPTPVATSTYQECEALHLSPLALSYLADFFKVLSEVSRLQIICCLKSGAKNVTQIMEETNLGQANVSKHLKLLAQAGVVSRTQVGVSVYYEIINPFIFDVCRLVCNSLMSQIEEQNQQLEQLKRLQNRIES